MFKLPRTQTINALKLFWTILVICFEYGIFWHSVRKCDWPDSKFQTTFTSTRPTHVLVVADPQILDHRSYPGRPAILTYITQVLVDLNIRKSWREATRLNPDAVIFLGDMMDGGRFPMSDAEYESYSRRFKSIFTLDPSIPQYFIPGNHDIGLRMSVSESKIAHERYVSHFGPMNQLVNMADHTLTLINAPGLVDEDHHRNQAGFSLTEWKPVQDGTVDFVEKLEGAIQLPVILFSHIPLYRPEGTDCGPLRERGTIRQGFGTGYQNLLEQDATSFLLHKLKPSLILSGDDHDYCEYNHAFYNTSTTFHAREVSVKSLSMAMNVRRPGFQLLSLLPKQYWKDDTRTTHADQMCLMPDQISIYLSIYIPFLLASLVFLMNIAGTRDHSGFNGSGITTTSYQQRTEMLVLRSTFGREDDDDRYYAHLDSLSLPTPVSTPKRGFLSRRSWWSFLLGRRRLSITRPLISLSKVVKTLLNFSGTHNPRHRGTIQGFAQDVWTVAKLPLSTIVFISLWTMYF